MSGIRKLPDYTCEGCGNRFRPSRSASRFCSRRCMWASNGGGLRKLPSAQEVNRLLWIEEWTTKRIAEHYGCHVSAVHHCMTENGIKAVPRRRSAKCLASNCKKPVCTIKHWHKGKYSWRPTIRCYYHHQMHIRRIRREYMRKFRHYQGTTGPKLVTKATPSKWIKP